MITVQWSGPDDPATATEIRDLLDEAAALDAEAGFSTAVLADGQPESSGKRFEAVARLEPERDADCPLVAFLRIDVLERDVGVAQLVVRPRYRSLGVGTLLLERIGTDMNAAGGWAGTGLTGVDIWAHGSHPAAGRMARRFGAVQVRAVWKLFRSLRGWDRDLAGEFDVAGVKVAPASAEEAGPLLAGLPTLLGTHGSHTRAVHPREASRLAAATRHLVAADADGQPLGAVRFSAAEEIDADQIGTIAGVAVHSGPDRQQLCAALVAAALSELADDGAHFAALYVDSDSADAVALTRTLEFEHDQSDLCYRLGSAGRIPARTV